MRRPDAHGPAREAPPSPAQFVLLVVCAFVALTAIVFVGFLNTAGVAGFIYAQF